MRHQCPYKPTRFSFIPEKIIYFRNEIAINFLSSPVHLEEYLLYIYGNIWLYIIFERWHVPILQPFLCFFHFGWTWSHIGLQYNSSTTGGTVSIWIGCYIMYNLIGKTCPQFSATKWLGGHRKAFQCEQKSTFIFMLRSDLNVNHSQPCPRSTYS